VDKEGVHPCHIGALPPQIAALVQSNVNVQELAVRGVAEKDKNKMMQAVLLDPLTSAVLSIDETVKVVEELFQSEKEYLRGFK
jgi:alpha-galactosidase